MPFLLDTNICSIHIKSRDDTPIFSQILQYGGQLAVSRLSVAELYAFAFRSNEKRVAEIETFLEDTSIVEFDEQCAREYGKIHASLADRGMRLDPIDLMIAATALIYGMTLVTHDEGFNRLAKVVNGLRVVDWL